jgi:hypothetical protein
MDLTPEGAGYMDPETLVVFLDFGIAAAILTGISRDRVLNLLSAEDLAERVGLICATKRRGTNVGSTTDRGD